MNTRHEALWSAIETALGAEKTAILRNAPLDELVRNKVAEDLGMDFQGTYTLPDAMVTIAAKRRAKVAEQQNIQAGINALHALYPEQTKHASTSPGNPLIERETLWHMVGAVKRAHVAEQYADTKTAAEIAAHREDVEDRIFKLLHKEAGAVADAVRAASKSNLAKGLALGTGAAIPAVVAGRYLTQSGVEDAQTAALQTAGLIGAGGLAAAGIYSAMKNRPQQQRPTSPQVRSAYPQPGMAPRGRGVDPYAAQQAAQMLAMYGQRGKYGSTTAPAREKLAAALDLDGRLDTMNISAEKRAALRRRARRDGVLALVEGLNE